MIAADDAQNDQRHTACVRFDNIPDDSPEEKAQQRHEPLKDAESNRQYEQARSRRSPIAKCIGNRNGEGIHRQCRAQHDDFYHAHAKTPCMYCMTAHTAMGMNAAGR